MVYNAPPLKYVDPMPLLTLRDACLAFGHVPLLDNAGLVVEAKERLCLVDRNGTGKSTLLNVLAGTQGLDSGERWVADGIRVAKLDQAVPEAADATVYEVVAQGLGDVSGLLTEFHALSHALGEGEGADQDLERLSRVQGEIDRLDAWDASQRVETILSRLRLPGANIMGNCSGGVRRRALLGQVLVSEPDVLLLDEPTNHLDIESILELEAALQTYQGTVVFITHDRSFIDGLATRVIELDRGQLRSYPGSYAAYKKLKEQELAVEADQNRKFDQHLAEEEAWIRQGIKARRTRNEGRVRRLQALRKERQARLEQAGKARLVMDQGRASGKIVFEAEGLSFSYGADTLVKNFTTNIMRGDRVGIIGANGTGKTTLLKLLMGDLQPTAGSVSIGTQLNVAYFDQERMQLDPERSVRDNLADGTDEIVVGERKQHVIGYLQNFLFPPARSNSPVKTLSGGERNRLLLAKLFTQPANLLVLDEPTNDLDVETLELLEELLADFTGTLLLVSHDRAFLDQTVTSTLVMEGDGKVGEYVGGYGDWLRQKPAVSDRQPQAAATAEKVQRSKRGDDKLSSNKLSYKETRELAELPEKIESLEAEQERLTVLTSDAEFYRRPEDEVRQVMAELNSVGDALETAYARWEDLEARQ